MDRPIIRRTHPSSMSRMSSYLTLSGIRDNSIVCDAIWPRHAVTSHGFSSLVLVQALRNFIYQSVNGSIYWQVERFKPASSYLRFSTIYSPTRISSVCKYDVTTITCSIKLSFSETCLIQAQGRTNLIFRSELVAHSMKILKMSVTKIILNKSPHLAQNCVF